MSPEASPPEASPPEAPPPEAPPLSAFGIALASFGDQHLYELNSREQTLLELYRQMNEHMQLQTLGLLLARITEGNTPNGDNNSNSALIAGIQSIKTSQKKTVNTNVIYVGEVNISL